MNIFIHVDDAKRALPARYFYDKVKIFKRELKEYILNATRYF